MRGALIHGVLLVVMLVYGYRTWTRDTTIKPDLGAVVLWDKHEADLVSLELSTEKKITKVERRGQGGEAYWWGIETTIEKKPKPPEVKPAEPPKPAEGSGSGAGSASGSGAGSAAKPAGAGSAAGSGRTAGSGSAAGSGSTAGSGSAATPPAVVEEEIRKTHEFPLGEAGDALIKSYVQAHAMRDLGQPTDEQQKDYKLNDAKTTVTVTFKDGTRKFLIGGSVYGGSDRYVADQQSKRAYVFSKDLISTLEIGESSLHLLDPRGYEPNRMESVTIEGDGKSKAYTRVQAGDTEGQQLKTWGDPTTKKPDQTVANFIDNTNNLRPTEFKPEIKVADLTLILKLTFKDGRGDRLGTLQLFKREKPGELPPNTDLDPANPPKGETEYLIITEKTRVPAVVRRDTAQRTEQDIATVFGEHPTELPKGNPFGEGTTPAVNPHGAAPPAPPNPHGGMAPAGGSTDKPPPVPLTPSPKPH